jgi:hypothetical protein
MRWNRRAVIRLPLQTAIVNHWVPPMVYGSAGKLYRLFRHVDPADYCVITSGNVLDGEGNVEEFRLPCPYVMLPSEWRYLRLPKAVSLQLAMKWVNVWLKVLQRARHVASAIRRQRCRAVVTCTGELEDLPAACLAARMTNSRFYPIMDDDFANQSSEPHKRLLARQMDSYILKRASKVFAVSERMAEEIHRRYGRHCHVLHTPAFEAAGQSPESIPIRAAKDGVTIVFSGTVYALSAGALSTLIRAVSRSDSIQAQVHVYTWQNPAQLGALGVEGSYVLHSTLGPTEIQTVHRSADILFMGLGFEDRYAALARTSFPSKLADYLVSGRPILALVPFYAYTAEFLRTNECAHVVEQDNASAVADGLQRIVNDAGYRQRMVHHAFDTARRLFDSEDVAQRFVGAMGSTRSQRISPIRCL